MALALTPDDLLETIAHMKIVDLTQTVEEGMPVYPTHPQFFHMRWRSCQYVSAANR